METYKSQFTQTNFKEELATFFPLIHSIMQETNTVDLEAFVNEASCPECHKDPCECNEEEVKESMFAQFEEWAEATEQGKLTDDEIEALKQAMSELPNAELELGPDGQTAWQFFSGLGLTDSDLEDKFKAASELDPSADPIEVLKMWAQESYPELLVSLGLSGSGQEEPAPAAPPVDPMAAPAPEQPVAENSEDGASMVQEVAKIVKSFYNRDNPDVGPFRGGEGIALDVEKQISEKFGEEAGQQARQMAEMFMEKLTNEWHQRHGQTGPVEPTDGLARLKELLGNVKQKVESISPEKEEPPFDPDPPRDGERKDQFGNPIKHIAKHLAKQGMKQAQGDGGELARLKELLGTVKEKVESIGSQDEAYNPNSVDAEHRRGLEASHEKHLKDKAAGGDKNAQSQLDALAQKKERMRNDYNDRMEREGVDKSQIPAYKRKEQGGDWKMSTKDLEKEKTNSPTSSAGLARKKAELGMSEELSAIMKLAGISEGDGPKKVSKKEVDNFQKKHNAKLTGREVNRQEQDKNKKK